MKLPQDFVDLIGACATNGVEYLIVGGYAVSYHARPRSTKDLDLWVRGSSENLARLGRALVEFGAPTSIAQAASTLSETEVLFFGQPPYRVDILRTIDGVSFDEAYPKRITVTIDGVDVTFADRETILRNKLASGRPQDLADVDALKMASDP
jgi:hypothetical protein